MPRKSDIIVYQAKNGAIELREDLHAETVWASQSQIVELFGVDQSVISRHIRNIFKDGEAEEKSNMQKMHIANSDRPVTFYSLDIILAVGYRTNSRVAIEFRKWATRTLHSHIINDYTVNPSRIDQNFESFMVAFEDVKKLVANSSALKSDDVLELIKAFAGTWFSLDTYDKSALPKKGVSKKQVEITADDLKHAVGELKRGLITRKEATEFLGIS